MSDILKEAIADAKAVRETALQNAKAALEEAFAPHLKNMLSAKLSEDEIEEDAAELDEIGHEEDEDDDEPEVEEEGMKNYRDDEEEDPEVEEAMHDDEEEEADDEVEMEGMHKNMRDDEMGDDEPDMDDEEEELDLEAIIRELEAEVNEAEEEAVEEAAEEEAVEESTDEEEAPVKEGEEEEVDESKEEKEVAEVTESLDDVDAIKSELAEYKEAVEFLQDKLHEVNILNAKLLFTNKLFKEYALDKDQKMKVVETMDRAQSTREIKLVYSTLAEAFSQAGKINRKQTVKESASKPVGNTKPKKIINEETEVADRFRKLAGII